MAFERTSEAPERIGIYGEPGSGKSSAIFSIAKRLVKTGSPARVHFVDTDTSYYDMCEEYPEARGVVLPTFVDQSEEGIEWESFKDAINRALKDADPKRGDWIAVDRFDPAWEWVQDAYAREAKEASIDEVRAEGRKKVASGEDKNLRAGYSGFEWGEVKSRFRRPFNKLITSGCNIVCTASATNITGFTDPSGETSKLYGGLPWAMGGGAGARLLAHMFRDILHMRLVSASKGEYAISAAKWRARPTRLSNATMKNPLQDFSFVFLMGVAGWRNSEAGESGGGEG